MPLAKCPRSGKLFDNSKGPVHQDVLADEEADYQKVLDYVAAHPNCGRDEVCKETGVDSACVERLLSQGRLESLTKEEVAEQERKNQERAEEVAQRNARLAQAFGSVAEELQSREPVKRVGSVHNTLEEKRRR